VPMYLVLLGHILVSVAYVYLLGTTQFILPAYLS
jgi:hypothetical protein